MGSSIQMRGEMMPKRLLASQPSQEERVELKRRLVATGMTVLEYKWARVVWHSAIDGLNAEEISSKVHLSVGRTRMRIRAWNRSRMAALNQGRSPGRPRKATRELGQALADEAAKAHPRDYG